MVHDEDPAGGEVRGHRAERIGQIVEAAVATELAERNGLVISTGGRLMLDPVNAAQLGRQSRVFCLVATPDELLRRVGTADGPIRPLLDDPHPARRIAELLAERAAGYARFEQVATDGRSVDEVVDEEEAAMAERKAAWPGPRKTDYASGAVWKFARLVGGARQGAVTHSGARAETHVYMDQ